MIFRKTLLRTVLAGLLLSSTTALADGDLTLTMSFVTKSGETAGVDDNIIEVNGTRQVKTHLAIGAGLSATGITLTAAAIPAGPDHYEVTAVTNCTPVVPGTPLPCTVADLQDGASVDVVTTLSQPLPATCTATPPAYTAFSLTATTTSADPDTANNTGSVTPVPASWEVADVGVDFTGSEAGNPNGNASYHVTVTNHGPCADTVTVFSNAAPGPVLMSATWECQNVAAPGEPALGYYEANGCELGVLNKDQVAEFDKVYFNPAPSDAVRFYYFNGASIGHELDDPNGDNDSSDLSILFTQSPSGCSTTGAGGPTGLLVLGGVLALVFRRRRAA